MVDVEELQNGVDAVGRFHEKRYGLEPPFHLSECGGCGCPSFQQPCQLCGFYPMCSDKGHWSPKVATKEMFCTMVDRSGPDGTGGTIATWHAACKAQGFRRDTDDAKRDALEVDVPSAAAYWEAVVENRLSIHRPTRPNAAVWRAVHEIVQYVLRDDTGQLARQAAKASEAIDEVSDRIKAELAAAPAA